MSRAAHSSLIGKAALALAVFALFAVMVVGQEANAQGTIPPEYQQYLDQHAAYEQSLNEQSSLGRADLSVADEVVERFKGVLDKMSETAGVRAKQLLMILFAIDLVLSVGRSLKGQESFPAMMQKLVTRISFVTLVILFIDYSAEFTSWLTEVAVRLGNEAMGAQGEEIKPSLGSIFANAWSYAGDMLSQISIWKPLSVFYIVTAFFLLLIAGIMMALLMTVYIELYMIALAGVIVLGFAGLESSKDSVATYIRTLIGKAFKILGLLIIFAMMTTVTNEVAGSSSGALGLELVLTILVLQIVTVVLLMTVPSSLEGLAGGIGATRAAEVIAGGVAMMAALPLAKMTAGASLGGGTGALKGGASALINSAGQGAGTMATNMAKGAMSGAGRGAARYGGAGLMRGQSLRAQLAKDVASYMNKKGSE